MLPEELTLPGHVSSVPRARHFVEELLSSWDLDDLGWEAALAVSELAANCALHARTEFTVRVRRLPGEGVRIEVSDASRRVPVQRDYGSDATTGRGLNMVGQIAQDWGVIPSAAGKTVWLLLGPPAPGNRDPRRTEPTPPATTQVDVDRLLQAFDDGTPTASAGRPGLRLDLRRAA